MGNTYKYMLKELRKVTNLLRINYRKVWLYVESDGQVVKVEGLGMDSIQKMLTANGVITRDQW